MISINEWNLATVTILVTVYLINHFFADFVKQTPAMAIKKSKSNVVLLHHVSVQTFWMFPAVVVTYFLVPITGWFIPIFFVCNFVIHFAIDWITSRFTTHFFKKNNLRKVFQTVGIDQALHYYTYAMIIIGCLAYL